jgi:HK97 family phage major capsid protein
MTTEPTGGQLPGAGEMPAPGSWRSALYRPDAPGARLDGQEWARSWPAFMRAITDPADASARQFIVNATPASFSERVPGQGGFLVPEVLRSQMLSFMTGAIVRPRAMILPMGGQRLSVPTLDNLTQASSTQALGGLTFAWAEEAAGITPSIPAFGRTVLEARKAAAYMVGVDNGFVDDAGGAFGDFMARVLAQGYAWFEDDVFFNGTGVGEPQGILNAPCAVAVTRTNSNGAATFADIIAMFKALHPAVKQLGLTSGVTTVAWLLSASVIDALAELYFNVGGASVPTTITPVAPPSWFSMGDGDKITPSLLGLPAIVTDHQPASGSVGDVALCDLSNYLVGDQLAMTVERAPEGKGFPSDASDFRIKSRIDGRYWIQSATTTEANQQVSPVVVLHLWPCCPASAAPRSSPWACCTARIACLRSSRRLTCRRPAFTGACRSRRSQPRPSSPRPRTWHPRS